LIINTGNGKGKTTAALGLAMRAAGHGLKVCFIQFIKGSWRYGEMESINRFEGLIDFHVMGKGFIKQSKNIEKDRAAANEAWAFAREAMVNSRYNMVVLDELTYLLTYEMLDASAILTALEERPQGMHVVITGRGAPRVLVEAADLVTEMRAVKHPYQQGVKAQKGVEF
jgi:cob(I)alamin adenosyltransferase